MNRLLVLLLVTASIAASGCTGVPEGTAGNGALVTVDWTARDPDTGEVLAQGSNARFVVGLGESGLGTDLERSVAGRQANETYTFVSRDDPSRAFDEELRTPQLLGTDDAEGPLPIEAFNRSLGHMPEVGEIFDYNPFYRAQVVAVGEENLTFRFHLEGGEQRDPVDFIGATLVSRIEDERLVRILEPNNGTRFYVQPPAPGAQTPLGLEPGSYITVGAEGGELVYRRADVSEPAIGGRPVEFEVTVRDVQQVTGGTTSLEEGKYGVRPGSPYVDGDPFGVVPNQPASGGASPGGAGAGAGQDDGHDDHTH